jgi:fructose-bisphosphate aldolase, class II
MPLVSIKNDLIQARRERFAVPLFDIFEMQGVEGTLDALIEKRAPTIMGIYMTAAAQPSCRAMAAYMRCRAEQTDVPISIMLDHGASVEQCLEVLTYGFTDVMYDGSSLPIEENIANTRRVVEAAHAAGAGVEAELGHVGFGDQYESFGGQRAGFTDPGAVAYFVEKTGVDFLAIAFGNAHGMYKGTPQLDLDLVAEIRKRVDVPLVMHGGTGLSDEQFRGAIAAGICKINFYTSISNTAVDNTRTAVARPDATLLTVSEGIRASYRSWCSHLYEVFGTAGKAA